VLFEQEYDIFYLSFSIKGGKSKGKLLFDFREIGGVWNQSRGGNRTPAMMIRLGFKPLCLS